MKKILFCVAASAALFTACNEAVNITPAEYGALVPSVPAVIDQIETKAVNVEGTSGTEYDISDWNIQVLLGQESKYSSTIEAYGTRQIFPVGDYTVAVQNVSEADAQPSDDLGQARFYGAASVNVEANKDNPVTVPCTMVNSKFSTVLSGFDVFTDYSIAVEAGTREYTYSKTLANAGYINSENNVVAGDVVFFNVASGNTLSYTLTATFEGVSKTYTGSISVAAAKHYVLKFTVSADNGMIVPTITINDACETINQNIPVNPYE